MSLPAKKVFIAHFYTFWRAEVRVASQGELGKTLASLRVREFESSSFPSLLFLFKIAKILTPFGSYQENFLVLSFVPPISPLRKAELVPLLGVQKPLPPGQNLADPPPSCQPHAHL